MIMLGLISTRSYKCDREIEGKFRVMEVESITTYSQLSFSSHVVACSVKLRLGYDYTVRFIVPILLYLRYVTL